jgi:hypothetical protein
MRGVSRGVLKRGEHRVCGRQGALLPRSGRRPEHRDVDAHFPRARPVMTELVYTPVWFLHPSIHKPRIDDEPDDGAEQRGDEPAVGLVMGLVHGADYAGHGIGVQIAIDSNCPLYPA